MEEDKKPDFLLIGCENELLRKCIKQILANQVFKQMIFCIAAGLICNHLGVLPLSANGFI
jgi:hypothetical protein